MNSEIINVTNELSLQALKEMTYQCNAPFSIVLESSEIVTIEKILRIIPARRLVGLGTWKGEKVVVKLFYDVRRSKIHVEKEARGVMMLQKIKIPTPPLLYQGCSHDGKIQVLIFHCIEGSSTLEALWWSQGDNTWMEERLQQVMVELATQHVFGVLQRDLHLENFLMTEKNVYTLDGAAIVLYSEKIDKLASMENIALFLSQLGVGVEALQVRLFRYYASIRGWIVKEEDITAIEKMIVQWNIKRWKQYEKKIFRNATDFKEISRWNKRGMIKREEISDAMQLFIDQPDDIFALDKSDILKSGRSSTVIQSQVNDKLFVIKRYNIKNLKHRIRRLFRKTRAEKCWRLANKLNLFGVRTAKPIAYLEYRFLGCRGRSYYVMEAITGVSLLEYVKKYQGQYEKLDKIISKVENLFLKLARLQVSHGDLKASNIIVTLDEEVVLLDLDGMVEHKTQWGLSRGIQKDIRRFLDNFNDYPSIKAQFQKRLINS